MLLTEKTVHWLEDGFRKARTEGSFGAGIQNGWNLQQEIDGKATISVRIPVRSALRMHLLSVFDRSESEKQRWYRGMLFALYAVALHRGLLFFHKIKKGNDHERIREEL